MNSLYVDQYSSMALQDALTNKLSVLILPLGSVEPHGPHLPLATDRLLSEENAVRAAKALREQDIPTWIGSPLAYGVTEYAQGFCGAISLSHDLYEELLIQITKQYTLAGFSLVCWINHHLEPLQLAAIHGAQQKLKAEGISVIAPAVVSKRWGKELGEEFRSGACHAGAYEGSMILCSHKELVQQEIADELPKLKISLSEAIRSGKSGFLDAGMNEAYTGAPAQATAIEGERLYQAHSTMVVTEVKEALSQLKG